MSNFQMCQLESCVSNCDLAESFDQLELKMLMIPTKRCNYPHYCQIIDYYGHCFRCYVEYYASFGSEEVGK
jgi:hypothetical protein